MPFVKRARARTGVLAALSVVSLGLLSMVPAIPAGASTAAVAVPLAQGAAFRLTAAAVPASVPAGSVEEKVTCAVIHLTGNKHEESVHCAELWFLSDGGVSESRPRTSCSARPRSGTWRSLTATPSGRKSS